jgi:transcriptional regulator with XRE-family HTH domain
MKATPTKFSEAVRELASTRYKSLREAAKDLGIHHGHFCRIVNGEVLPEADLLERMVATLHLSVLERIMLFKDYTLAKLDRDLARCRPETRQYLVQAMKDLGLTEPDFENLTRAA